MRFVARLLKQAERWRASCEAKRLTPSNQEDFFIALREANGGKRTQPERVERRPRRRQLSLAAIDDNEIGKVLLLLKPPLEIARDDFAHRSEVVSPLHCLHAELAILGAARPAVIEPDHGSDGIRALRCGDVEAHQRTRQPLQPELATELVHRARGPLLRFQGGQLQLFEQVTRVLLGQPHELAPWPALWNVDGRAGQRFLEQLAILHVEREQQLWSSLPRREIAPGEIR